LKVKKFLWLCLLLALMLPLCGWGVKSPRRTTEINKTELIIDDFEDGEYQKKPEWWAFDKVKLQVTPEKRLLIQGATNNWYVGGFGIYLAKENQDLSKYTSLDLDVYGYGLNSGILKIELYDDDNGNWQIEQDMAKGYAPIYDDRFVYELKVDWKGFKHVSIPIEEFVDNNPEAGDNVWNPQQLGGSGGLLQMQFIVMATSKTGKVEMELDNIKLVEAGARR